VKTPSGAKKAGNYTLELTVGNGAGSLVKKTVAVTVE